MSPERDIWYPRTMDLRRAFSPIVLATAVAAGGAACSDETAGGGAGGQGGAAAPDDGKVRPPTSGVAIDEAVACAKVESAFQGRVSALGCAGTIRSCPDLVKAPSGAPACSQYDEGAADGCASYVREGADCEDVRTRLDACIVAHVEGSEPAGCP